MRTPFLKFMLTVHIVASVGWLGAAGAFVALNSAALTNADSMLVRSAYLGMRQVAEYAILPLSLMALGSGVVQALASEWKLTRHYWVLLKLVLTAVAAAIFLAKLPLIRRAAELGATDILPPGLRQLGVQLEVHSTGGLVVLAFITGISVFKPWGKTAWASSAQPDRGRPKERGGLRQRTVAIIVVLGVAAVGLLIHHLLGGEFSHRADSP